MLGEDLGCAIRNARLRVRQTLRVRPSILSDPHDLHPSLARQVPRNSQIPQDLLSPPPGPPSHPPGPKRDLNGTQKGPEKDAERTRFFLNFLPHPLHNPRSPHPLPKTAPRGTLTTFLFFPAPYPLRLPPNPPPGLFLTDSMPQCLNASMINSPLFLAPCPPPGGGGA